MSQALSQMSTASRFSIATGAARHELEIELMVDKLFDEYDLGKDGSISYAEFLFAMTGLDFYLHESSYKTKTSKDISSDDEDEERRGKRKTASWPCKQRGKIPLSVLAA